jgi:aminoglycoside 6'-N-acetyltransferase I
VYSLRLEFVICVICGYFLTGKSSVKKFLICKPFLGARKVRKNIALHKGKMKVRPVTAEDKAEWLRMHFALWPQGSLEEHEADIKDMLINNAKDAVLVCEREDGGLQGFIEVSIRSYAEGCSTDRVGYLEGWYVDEDARLQGVGRALVEAAEAWAISQGCVEMASDTELENLLSQKAHARLGYEEVERIVCFKKTLPRQ